MYQFESGPEKAGMLITLKPFRARPPMNRSNGGQAYVLREKPTPAHQSVGR